MQFLDIQKKIDDIFKLKYITGSSFKIGWCLSSYAFSMLRSILHRGSFKY